VIRANIDINIGNSQNSSNDSLMLTINGLSFFGPITRGFPEGLRGEVSWCDVIFEGVVKGVTPCDRWGGGQKVLKKSVT